MYVFYPGVYILHGISCLIGGGGGGMWKGGVGVETGADGADDGGAVGGAGAIVIEVEKLAESSK